MENISAQPSPLQEEELKNAEEKLEQLSAEPHSPEESTSFDDELQNIDSNSDTRTHANMVTERVGAALVQSSRSPFNTLIPLNNEEYVG